MDTLKITKVRDTAVIPERATSGSAGLDLRACIEEPVRVPARGHAVIPTGLAIALPSADYAAMIFARSGLAIKHGLGLLNGVGVVDSDYRGEIAVGIVNVFDEEYIIEPGERIAQMVFAKHETAQWEEVDALEESARGAGGFGSTGRG